MKALVLILLAVLLSGCVSATRKFVVFPTQGQDFAQIDFDKQQCEQFARDNKNNDDALIAAGMGSLIGSAYGAAWGALVGSMNAGVKSGALIGAAAGLGVGVIAGVAAGAASDHQRYLRIYATCMQLRGYTVTG